MVRVLFSSPYALVHVEPNAAATLGCGRRRYIFNIYPCTLFTSPGAPLLKPPCYVALCQANRALRSRRLFPTTLTELNAIAALASMGLRSSPNAGYSTPAAIGMPMTL